MVYHGAIQSVSAYIPFVVRTDNNLLTYGLTMPNLDATGHRWVGVFASFEFTLEYQKGADNGTAEALSHIPMRQSNPCWRVL